MAKSIDVCEIHRPIVNDDFFVIHCLETFKVSTKVKLMFGPDAVPENYPTQTLLDLCGVKNLRFINSDGSVDWFENGTWVRKD
jgi:hypothetical protein